MTSIVTMRRPIAVTICSLAALMLAAVPATAVEPQTVAKMLEPSVVRVLAIGPDGAVSGTGFVVSREGHLATNFHVVEAQLKANWEIFVAAGDGAADDRRAATLIETFPGEDLAILQVPGLDRPPAVLAATDPKRPAQGMPIFTIGFPAVGGRLGASLETSFATGVVSRMFTGSWSEEGPKFRIIQHSAPTNPGSSGGPIVNACGQVVGVNSQREMAILIGPGGIPIPTDFIQGVFFASHISVLIDKLKELNIDYVDARKVCMVFLGVASTNFFLYGLIAILLGVGLVIVVIAYVLRPPVVIRVVERCRCAVRDSLNAVRRGR